MGHSGGQMNFMDLLFGDSTPQVAVSLSVHAKRHGVTKITRIVRIHRTPSETLLRQYPWLRGIEPDEWDEFFGRTGSDWTSSDIEYLVSWWGKADIAELCYALERPPWNLQRVVSRLRAEGVDIPYLREEKGHERRE